MRRLLLILLITGLAAVGLVALIEYDAGYVLISYGRTTVETSFWLALILLVSIFFALHYLLRAWRRALSSGGYFSSWSESRNSRRSQQRTSAGLINFIAGNWSRGRRQLLAGAKHGATPVLNYLLAARASARLGDGEQAQKLLRQAAAEDKKADVVIELTRAQMQLDSDRFEDALATLMRVRDKAAKHPRMLEMLLHIYEQKQDWQNLNELLPELKKYHILDETRLLALRNATGRACLQSSLKDKSSEGSAGKLEAVRHAWKSLAEEQRRQVGVIAVFVRLLLESGGDAEAEKILTRQLKKSWDDELVRLYGLTAGVDVYKQLVLAEGWLRDRPNNGELLLCTGRLALRNQLWGKAREYFQSSHKLLQTPETCAELGRLLAALGDHAQSNGYFQRGLLLSEPNLPALPLPRKPAR